MFEHKVIYLFYFIYLIIYFHKCEMKKGNQGIELKTADMNPTVR